jgi:hypothetical protein
MNKHESPLHKGMNEALHSPKFFSVSRTVPVRSMGFASAATHDAKRDAIHTHSTKHHAKLIHANDTVTHGLDVEKSHFTASGMKRAC